MLNFRRVYNNNYILDRYWVKQLSWHLLCCDTYPSPLSFNVFTNKHVLQPSLSIAGWHYITNWPQSNIYSVKFEEFWQDFPDLWTFTFVFKKTYFYCHHLLSETQFAKKKLSRLFEQVVDPRTACAFGEDLQLKLERVLNLEHGSKRRIRFGPLIDPKDPNPSHLKKKHDPILTHRKTPHPCMYWSFTHQLEGSIVILPRRIGASVFCWFIFNSLWRAAI